MKMILVQPVASHREHLKSLLEKDGFEVLAENSITRCITLLTGDPAIDLVVSDIDIPGRGGLHLLRNIRSTLRFQWLPIIITGSSFKDGVVDQCLELGVNDIVVLPTNDEKFTTKVKKAVADGKRRILLVSSEPLIIDLLGHFLEIERFRVLFATSAEEAMKIMDEENINVVVSDIMLPGVSGLDLLANVKEAESGVPVILITGFEGRFAPQDAIASGADGFFDRPFKNTEMIYTLRKVLAPNQPGPLMRSHKTPATTKQII